MDTQFPIVGLNLVYPNLISLERNGLVWKQITY